MLFRIGIKLVRTTGMGMKQLSAMLPKKQLSAIISLYDEV